MLYAHYIKTTDGTSIEVVGFKSPEEAKERAEIAAKEFGYKPPPKWKFWDQQTWVKA